MTKFVAQFSTGEVFTRNSNHPYVTACAWVNIETGQVKNVSFSSNLNPTPDRVGIFFIADRFMSNKQRTLGARRNAELSKIWRAEVVQLSILN